MSRIDEEKKTEGFQTVEVQDSFLYKGRVEQIGIDCAYSPGEGSSTTVARDVVHEGSTVLFAKYSPHTQTVTIDGQDMKIIRTEDLIAVE